VRRNQALPETAPVQMSAHGSRVLLLLLAASGCGGGASPGLPSAAAVPTASGTAVRSYGGEAIPKAFVRRRGAGLIVGEDDRPIRLRGVAFGNEVWGNPASAPASHHAEVDYDR
jgi:hypothetical protein